VRNRSQPIEVRAFGYDPVVNERNIRIGIVASALSSDPRESPRLARQLDIDGLLFDAYSTSLDLPELSQTGRREFVRVLAAENRQLVGLRADLGPKGFGPGADVDRLLSHLDKALEAAVGLQSPLVTIDVGPLPEPPADVKPAPRVTQDMAGLIIVPTAATPAAPAPPAPPTPLDETLASHVDAALFELGRRADRYGVTVALRSDLASFAALERALRAASCPWFGIDLDPVAILRDAWTLDETLSRLGQLVRHVRARDATVGAAHRTSPAVIGRGSTDWPLLLSQLDAAGYSGWITIDPMEHPDRRAAAAAGLPHLRRG
jgi:sugar phosphate isomerase/epimerase